MRPGRSHRADAILNSPIVRALVKSARAGPRPPLPAEVLLPELDRERSLSPPKESDLISTQPKSVAMSLPMAVFVENVADRKGKKRARAEDDGSDDEDGIRVQPGVEVSYTVENLPVELKKYWAQRYRLFSKFDEGVQMDLEGWYSVTPESIAAQIAERCRTNVIVDAFCGVGGNAIQFALTCEKVIAIDISPTRLACARHNAEIYGVADRIEFVLGDWITWSREYVARKERGEVRSEDEVEVVFLSPPWGGIDYQTLGAPGHLDTHQAKKSRKVNGGGGPVSTIDRASSPPRTAPAYPLSALAPVHGNELFALARAITPHVAYYLPRNVDLHQVAILPRLSPRSDLRSAVSAPQNNSSNGGEADEADMEAVEIEEEWMGWKLKAVTAYFGDLAVNSPTTWVEREEE